MMQIIIAEKYNYIQYIFYLTINRMKTQKSIDKKKIQEGRHIPVYQFKTKSPSLGIQTHMRTSSYGKNKKLRLNTDYQSYGYKGSQQKKNGKTYYSKQRKDSEYYSHKHSQDERVHSTKSNAQRNLQLRFIFNKSKQQEEDLSKNKKKGNTTHHPLLKYVNKSKQNPYTAQIQRLQNLYEKIRKSTSKAKPRKSVIANSQTKKPTRELSISLKKNQIRLDSHPQTHKNQNVEEKDTVKTIKKYTGSTVNRQDKNQCHNKDNYRSQSRNLQKKQQKDADADEDEYDEEESFGMTEQQQQTFGDRFPYGFQKLKLLGRGGFSLVWLGKHLKSGKKFAIKQIITQNTHQTHIKQIWFGTNFFTLGGIPKPQYSKYPGIKNLVRMYSYEINQSDTWIFYEKCGQSLGSNLYDIRSEKVYGDQRLYKIFFKQFYEAMAVDPKLLKSLIVQICKPLAVLSVCGIVHSDLKTQNLLIKYEVNNEKYKLNQVKLIDYGSSFQFKNIAQFSMATPEYMPPQILNYIIHENQGQYQQDLYEEVMQNYKNPWIVDIFSLGCVLLEIVVGVPLWMSLPLLVPNKYGTSYCQKQGLFAVKGRVFAQIIKKQRNVMSRLDQILSTQNYSKIQLTPATHKVIKGMLQIDFSKRISPAEVIKILQAQE